MIAGLVFLAMTVLLSAFQRRLGAVISSLILGSLFTAGWIVGYPAVKETVGLVSAVVAGCMIIVLICLVLGRRSC